MDWIGLRGSPYRSIQHMTRRKYIACRDRKDLVSPFCWKEVVYNFPGTSDYDPSKPWVMKVWADRHLASKIYC